MGVGEERGTHSRRGGRGELEEKEEKEEGRGGEGPGIRIGDDFIPREGGDRGSEGFSGGKGANDGGLFRTQRAFAESGVYPRSPSSFSVHSPCLSWTWLMPCLTSIAKVLSTSSGLRSS